LVDENNSRSRFLIQPANLGVVGEVIYVKGEDKSSVNELIKIADGGNFLPSEYEYSRKHWYSSISKRCTRQETWEYNLQDQLNAIRDLGYTRSKIALEYLKRLKSYKVYRQSAYNTNDHEGYDIYNFPEAKGELSKILHFSIHTRTLISSSLGNDWYEFDVRDEDEFPKEIDESQAYKTITSAINELEKGAMNDLQ
jgi:hypothetical protein